MTVDMSFYVHPQSHGRCECQRQPACFGHEAVEWGGGEPDDCAPHDHLEGAELEAGLAILDILSGVDSDRRGRLIRFEQWKLDNDDA